MKKVYFFFLLSLISNILFSQNMSGGIKAGLSIANISVSGGGLSTSLSSKTGFLLGGYVTIMTSEKFGIQPELVYTQMGFTAPSGLTGSASINYLSIPAILRYNVSENINIQAGPQLNVLLSATGDPGSVDIKDQLNGVDFGGVFGLGCDFGKFNASVRYNLGFSELFKNTTPGVKTNNTAFQIAVGYALFGK